MLLELCNMCSNKRTLKGNKWKVFHVIRRLPSDPSFMLPLWSVSQTTQLVLNPPLITLSSNAWKGKVRKALIFFVLFFPPYFPPPSPPALDERLRGSWFPPCLLSRRVSWGNRRYWLSWWRCHQSQMGGWGSGRGQSKCQGSERKGPWAGLGGNWEAPPKVFLLFL